MRHRSPRARGTHRVGELIVNKRATGRTKDLADVEALWALTRR
jgi:hypothetical protein